MTEEQAQEIRSLVQQKKYDEARALLLTFKDDPNARQWLATLENVMAREPSPSVKIRLGPGQYYLDSRRFTVYFLAGAGLFLLTHNLVPWVFFVLADRWFNSGRKLDAHRIFIPLVIALGLYFALYAVLVVVRMF